MIPDSKVHGANMGPTWDLSAPDGPHVGPMNLAIRDELRSLFPAPTLVHVCYILYQGHGREYVGIVLNQEKYFQFRRTR